MQQADFNRIVNRFPDRVISYFEQMHDEVAALKHALDQCNDELIQVVENKTVESLSLEELIVAYPLDVTENLELISFYLLILPQTWHALSLMTNTQPALIDIQWDRLRSDKGANGEKEETIQLLVKIFLTKYPFMENFLNETCLAEAMKNVLKEGSNPKVERLAAHVKQGCDVIQQTRLSNVLADSLTYSEFAYYLAEFCAFDLNELLESHLVNAYILWKINENLPRIQVLINELSAAQKKRHALKKAGKPFSIFDILKKQIHRSSTDRTIIYIYHEYLNFHHQKLRAIGVNFKTEMLPNHERYEAWCNNSLLKERLESDSDVLYQWFKQNRLEIEVWYKTNFFDYQPYWSDAFFIEVKNRCLLLAENSHLHSKKRTVLAEIFNEVFEMHAVLTPHGFLEIMESFELRLSRNVALFGRESQAEKEMAFQKTIEGINRDVARVLAEKIFSTGMASQLLESVRVYAQDKNLDYAQLLRDLLGNTCLENEENIFYLEKNFLVFSLMSNLINYLFTYTYADRKLLGTKCAWNAVSGSCNETSWGLVKGSIFDSTSADGQLLPQKLMNPRNHAIDVTDFYDTFQCSLRGLRVIAENEDLIDKLLPLPNLSKPSLSKLIGRRTSSSSAEKVIPSKAREALRRYHVMRSKTFFRASDRSIYEAQLESMARREEASLVTDYNVAGLFLLIVLSVQSKTISTSVFLSLYRNGLSALLDTGFDDSATGSHLEQVLGSFEFTVRDEKNETESVTLSRLEIACTTPHSPDHLVAFSSASMQDAYWRMQDDMIELKGNRHPFFTSTQKELVYNQSYLCAMQAISARAEAAGIFSSLEAEGDRVRGFFKVIENAVKNLLSLSERVSDDFPELAEEEYTWLRLKFVCFLVLSQIYSTLSMEPSIFNKTRDFLETLLNEFFSQKRCNPRALQAIRALSCDFFNKHADVLCEGVDRTIFAGYNVEGFVRPSLLEWAKGYDFSLTLRDQSLLENFLENYAPIVASTAQDPDHSTLVL